LKHSIRGLSSLRAPGTLFLLILAIVNSLSCSSQVKSLAQSSSFWTKQLGATGAATYGYRVASDTQGDIYIVGATYGNLDGNSLIGSEDAFISKYDLSGTKQWTRLLGGTSGSTTAGGATADSSGNIYVCGHTSASLPGNSLTGISDAFVAKYDSNGNQLWVHQFGSSGNPTFAAKLTMDGFGNLFVTGSTGGGLSGNTLTGTQDFFLAKYDTSGNVQWTKQLGAASAITYGYGVGSDAAGNTFVTGMTLGGLDGNVLAGTADSFVSKYDASGVKQWTRQLGALSSHTGGNQVISDPSGNLYVIGNTTGFLSGNTMGSSQQAFLAKYDLNGNKLWTVQLGGIGPNTFGFDGRFNSSGNILLVGATDNALNQSTQTGTSDYFLAEYDANGGLQWVRQSGIPSVATSGQSVATDSSGNIYVGGYTSGGMDGNSLMGTTDFFIAKYSAAGVKK